MLNRIITLCIAGALGLLALALIWPNTAQSIAVRLLKEVSDMRHGEVPLVGTIEPPIKIVDPEEIPKTISAIPQAVKKDVSVLSSLILKRWNNKSTEDANLTVEEIIAATNKERIAAGLVPLQPNELLIESSNIKTVDMIAKQYFEHTSPDGVTVSDLGTRVGYDYIIMGENLALGNFKDASDLVVAWMNSPGHRANILSPMYQEIGVYAASGTYQGHTVWFAVQHFGTNRSVCPAISQSQKRLIDEINRELTRRQLEITNLRQELEHTDADGEEYQQMVNRFNHLVEEYNSLLSASKLEISAYNKSVANFNNCLSKYQAPSDH